MIITKKVISRRAMLHGMGSMLALPLLDAMVPALEAKPAQSGKPIHRFGVMYIPNGMIMNKWTPVLDGTAYEFSPTLSSLAPFRDQLLVLSNLACVPTPGRPGGAHAKATTRFLTDISPPTSETWLDAGTSVDQILAQETGKHTQLSSLELAIENGETAGACDGEAADVIRAKIAVERAVAADGPALRALGVPVRTPLDVVRQESGDANAEEAAVELAAWPVALVHGDLTCERARRAERGVVLVRWSAAHLGCGLLDAVRLAADLRERGRTRDADGLVETYVAESGGPADDALLRAAKRVDALLRNARRA